MVSHVIKSVAARMMQSVTTSMDPVHALLDGWEYGARLHAKVTFIFPNHQKIRRQSIFKCRP